MNEKTKSPAELAADEAELELLRLSAARRKAYEDRPDRKINFLKEHISNLKKLKVDALDSIQSSVRDVDRNGNIVLRNMPGIGTDHSEHAIVRSNIESRQERVNAIDAAIDVVEILIAKLKPTGDGNVPQNLEKFVADLIAKLPDRDEAILVHAPAAKKEVEIPAPVK